VGHEEEKHFGFSSFYCLLFQLINRKSMFAVLHSDINNLKSGLLHLIRQPYCKKSRSAKVKDGILRNYLVDRYKVCYGMCWALFVVIIDGYVVTFYTVVVVAFTNKH
jgi:hypothetical protein